jgi:predicted lipoprotein with Yx(FWY)xxD motif
VAQVWPPPLAHGNPPTASGAAQAQLFGTTARGDGTRQVTYNGHPHHYFASDKIDPDRSPGTSPAHSAPTRTAGGTGTGTAYGY